MKKRSKVYSLYKGDKELAFGRIDEIAKKMNISEKTVTFYSSPTYKNRGLGEKSTNRRILICVD